MRPILLKNVIPSALLKMMNDRVGIIQSSGKTISDDDLFKRQGFHNDPFFARIHHDICSPLVQKKVGEKLTPSYNFLALYHMNEGICPIHLDRPQCYITLDICLDQKRIWPLFVNPNEYESININDRDVINNIKERSLQFDLSPGDGIIYFGTKQPHWRNKIDADNFCNLVFFHFVNVNFEGDLN